MSAGLTIPADGGGSQVVPEASGDLPIAPADYEATEPTAAVTAPRTRKVSEATERPIIEIIAGELHTNATEAEHAIVKAGLPVFQRGHKLVQPGTHEAQTSDGRTVLITSLNEITGPGMVDILCSVAGWERWDARRKAMVRTNPPTQVADILLARVGRWHLPTIAGVITAPTIRRDGSILSMPGYDSITRLYYAADPTLRLHPDVDEPTRKFAERAVHSLKDLLSEFPLVDDVSTAVALSGLITPLVRGAISVAPMHLYRAPTPGSGKSYLADVGSAILTGRECPVIAAASEEETEKRLVGLLIAGLPIISLDNVNGEVGGDLLCQAVERPLLRVRKLGRNDIFELESRATIIATGNNARVRGDMVRRTLIADLDPEMERPETRIFKRKPVQTVLANRGWYVSACIAIVRSYFLAGCPNKLPPIASFDLWSDLVRSALVWLGCADPAESIEAAREDDPELGELREMASAWNDAFGSLPQTIKRAVQVAVTPKTQQSREADGRFESRMALPYPQLYDILQSVAGSRGGDIDARRLGIWMQSHQGRVVAIPGKSETVRFKRQGHTGGAARWMLVGARTSGR